MKTKNILLFLVAGILFAIGSTASAATLTVTTVDNSSVGSDGECSLLEAINNANGSADITGGDCNSGQGGLVVDTINFNIPGSGVHTIATNSQFSISDAVTIDATTQPGTVCDLDGGSRILKINIDASGISSSSNAFDFSAGSAGSTIKGLAIYGNTQGSGITLTDDDITIQCNNIGTDAAGLAAFPNSNGISIYNERSGILIGGSTSAEGNLISGNGLAGSSFDGAGIGGSANDIVINHNWIGVDITGQSALMNDGLGIGFGNGTSVPTDNISILNNVISGNGRNDGNYSPGINLGSGSETDGTAWLLTNVTIQGNIIGLSADGTVAIPNENDGLFMGSEISGAQIGGAIPGQGNIVSGNAANGIVISYTGDNIAIQGNIIGLDITGTEIIGNGSNGINLNDGSDTYTLRDITIGGLVEGARNIISGNNNSGIFVDAENVVVQGNYVGTDITGLICLANTNQGIQTGQFSTDVTIGGSVSGAGNIIGCSNNSGIYLDGANATVSGNFIGVGSDGTTDISGDSNGIYIERHAGTTLIGGATSLEGNVIKNTFAGITVAETNSPITIQGNTVSDSSSGGVLVYDSSANSSLPRAAILANSIFNNDRYGIDLARDVDGNSVPELNFRTQNNNDSGDADEGPNGYINNPLVLGTVQDGSNTIVTYSLDVPVSSFPYHVEFFTNPTYGIADSGYGEGEVYHSYANETVSTAGAKVFTKTLIGVDIEDVITLTVTDCADLDCTTFGGTSEFSNSAPPGVDYGTSSGSQTLLSDNGAAHILNTIHLGACVNSDSGTGSNTDADGPNQMGAFLGTGPCTDDRDGVFFVGDLEVVDIPGSVSETLYIEYTPEDLNDAVFSGAYTGEVDSEIYAAVATTSPDNGDTADYFVWGVGDEDPGVPVKITPGVPQLLRDGVYITFAGGTGHSPVDFDNPTGGIWIANLIAPSTGFGNPTAHVDPYGSGETIELSIEASDNGYLHLWIDLNHDGDFSDADEWYLNNEPVTAGDNLFDVDLAMDEGTYNMRVRYVGTSTPDLLPTGLAPDGEVEDYQFSVESDAEPEPEPAPKKRRVIGSVPKPSLPKSIKPATSTLPASSILGSGQCSAELIIHDFMKQGDRNGTYSNYNKKVTKEVNILQAHINRILAAQYNQAAGPVDGIFGPLTKQGVMRLQTALNSVLKPVPSLVIDGIVGPFTREAINNSCGK